MCLCELGQGWFLEGESCQEMIQGGVGDFGLHFINTMISYRSRSGEDEQEDGDAPIKLFSDIREDLLIKFCNKNKTEKCYLSDGLHKLQRDVDRKDHVGFYRIYWKDNYKYLIPSHLMNLNLEMVRELTHKLI